MATMKHLTTTIQSLQNDQLLLTQEIEGLNNCSLNEGQSVGQAQEKKERQMSAMKKMVAMNELIGHILKYQKVCFAECISKASI